MAALNVRMVAVSMIAATMIPTLATGLEGRYIGSVYRTEGVGDGEIMRHLYDVMGRRDLPSDLDLRLRMSLDYHSRPGTADSDLLRSRFQGDLRRGSTWRGSTPPTTVPTRRRK